MICQDQYFQIMSNVLVNPLISVRISRLYLLCHLFVFVFYEQAQPPPGIVRHFDRLFFINFRFIVMFIILLKIIKMVNSIFFFSFQQSSCVLNFVLPPKPLPAHIFIPSPAIYSIQQEFSPQIILNSILHMDNHPPKQLFDSVSSKSIEPPFRDFQASNIFGGRKSSFDYVNISKESDPLIQKEFRNSFDALLSNINGTKAKAPLKNIIQLYENDQDKLKIEQLGFKPLNMQEVNSDSEEIINVPSNFPLRVQPIKFENPMKRSADTYDSYFSEDFCKLLKDRQIPLKYVRSLLQIKNLKEVKSTRRLKVERYLEKRRKKTWDRKICYNCRQKVAEERLRIKGKFIKKRRAMEILGIVTPIQMNKLKEKLEHMLKDKTNEEIDQIIRVEDEK